MRFLKSKQKDEYWLTQEDKDFIAQYRRQMWQRAMIIFLLGAIVLLAAGLLKHKAA